MTFRAPLCMSPKAVCYKYDTTVTKSAERSACGDNRPFPILESLTAVRQALQSANFIKDLVVFSFPPTSNVVSVSRHLVALPDSHEFLPALISKLHRKAAIYLFNYSKTVCSPFTSFYLQPNCTERKTGTTNNESLEAKFCIKISPPQKQSATRYCHTAPSSFSFSVYRLPISCFKGVKIQFLLISFHMVSGAVPTPRILDSTQYNVFRSVLYIFIKKCTINITQVYIQKVTLYIIHTPTCFAISISSSGSSTPAPC